MHGTAPSTPPTIAPHRAVLATDSHMLFIRGGRLFVEDIAASEAGDTVPARLQGVTS